MIEKQKGEYTVVCDQCGDSDDEPHESFAEAVQAFKDAGGRVRPEGANWEHICVDCRKT